MCFFLNGDSYDLNYWYIDDVLLSGAGSTGTIEGTVTLDGGTGNVEAVEVTAGSVTVNPDNNGDYEIAIAPGTYDVTATLDDYEPDTVTGVVVLENVATTGVDLTLLYSPSPFDPPENVAVDPYTGTVIWDPPGGTIIEENFDGYNVGDYLCVVAPDLWQTWSNIPGGAEDVLISDDQSLSPLKFHHCRIGSRHCTYHG